MLFDKIHMFSKIPYPHAQVFLWICALQLVLIIFLFLQPIGVNNPHVKAKQAIVHRFVLSDYCFSTESRHVRHLSSPEWIAPFQDFPGYLEHFPSSSFFPIPPKK